MINRKYALIAFVFADLLAILGIYMGYHWLSEIFDEVNSAAEIIEYQKYTGYVFLGIILPVIHIYGIIETLWPMHVRTYIVTTEKIFIGFAVFLFTSCIFLTNWVPHKLQKEGYVYCHTSSFSVASRILVYAKNDVVCQEIGPGPYQQLINKVLENR